MAVSLLFAVSILYCRNNEAFASKGKHHHASFGTIPSPAWFLELAVATASYLRLLTSASSFARFLCLQSEQLECGSFWRCCFSLSRDLYTEEQMYILGSAALVHLKPGSSEKAAPPLFRNGCLNAQPEEHQRCSQRCS